MMGMGMGVGFSSPPPWTPAAIPGCILYCGGYREDRAVRAASPTIPGAGWTGANWAGAGLGPYLHTAGATNDLAQAVLIAGNRYVTGYTVSGRTAGTVTHKQGTAAGTTRSADGTYSDELTAQSTAAIWTPSNDFDGAVLVQSIVNRSLTSYTPAFTTIPGSVLAQETPTAQPWVSSDGLGIRYQGGDMLRWSAAASAVKCLHDGTGGTLLVGVRFAALTGRHTIAASCIYTAANQVGAAINYTGANQIITTIRRGVDVDLTLAANTPIAVGTNYVFALRVASGANGVTLWKNGAVVATGALTAPSAADPTNALGFGAHSAGSTVALDGSIPDVALYNRALTDAEIAQATANMLARMPA